MLKISGFVEYPSVIDYDFSCYVIKYGCKSINGKIYQKDSLKDISKYAVPLLWNHRHNDPGSVLGCAKLQNREDGVYAYCKMFGDQKETVIELVRDRGFVSLSPCINKVKIEGEYIVSGTIIEVSLVLARVDPDEDYYPVMKGEELL